MYGYSLARENVVPELNESGERWRGIETAIMLTEMASCVAHRLKNPLAGMMLAATRLRRLLGNEREKEKALTVAEHLCSSIDAFSRSLDESVNAVVMPQIRCESVDVNEILVSALAKLSVEAKTRHVEICRELSPDIAKISGNAEILRAAFSRLLFSALRALPQSGTLRIVTSVAPCNWTNIRIEDDRPDVDVERMRKLMEKPFSQENITAADLELCVLRRVVHLHSGTISLETGAGPGISIVVGFPALDGGARDISEKEQR